MRLQLAKHPRALAFAVAQDLRHRDRRVVVDDRAWYAAEVAKRGVVTFAECLRRLRRKGFHESVIAVRQIDH